MIFKYKNNKIMLKNISIFSTIFNDAPQPWQLGFQDSAAPGFTGIVELHNTIFFYLVVISVGVFWVLGSIIYYYNSNNSPIVHKYLNHGTLIELIWTITPAFILIAIAFPSFRLLYLLDEVISPTITIKVVGFLKIKDGHKSYVLNKIKDTKYGLKKIYIEKTYNIVSLTSLYIQSIKFIIYDYTISLLLKLYNFSYINLLCNYNTKNNNLISNNRPQAAIISAAKDGGGGPRLTAEDRIRLISLSHPSLRFLLMDWPIRGRVNKRSFHSMCRAINRIGPHNEEVLSVIIGLLLGDGYANNRSGEGVRISIKQSIIHKEYLFNLYEFFSTRGYCTTLKPRKYQRTIKGIDKIYYGYEFNTFTFRSFFWIYKSFYKNGKKIVPTNIEKYITPLTLAIWISDDGGWVENGVRISCNSFTLKEVEYLLNILIKKFNLSCTIQKIHLPNKYSIYIKKESIYKLRELVLPHMHKSMFYKLGLS